MCVDIWILKWLQWEAQWCSPPLHSTALQQALHAQHVTWLPPPSCECVSAWLLIHTTCVCVWDITPPPPATPPLFYFLWLMSSSRSLLLSDSSTNQILKGLNEFCISPTRPSLSPFPQKRAKKLEGETIYIRHSNLMLEVCIFSLRISVLSVCRHVSLPARKFCRFSFFCWLICCVFHHCLVFSLTLKAWHALFTSLILMQVASLLFDIVSVMFLFSFCDLYDWEQWWNLHPNSKTMTCWRHANMCRSNNSRWNVYYFVWSDEQIPSTRLPEPTGGCWGDETPLD